MLKIDNKPILQKTLEIIRDQLGIKSIIVDVEKDQTEIQDYFNKGKGNFNLTQDQYYDIFPSDKPVVDTGGGGEGQTPLSYCSA